MSSVAFLTLWLNPAADPSAGMAFSLHEIDYNPAISLTTKQYAGGNFRVTRQKGKQRVAKVTLNFLTPAQVFALKAWHGELLWLRDPEGEKFAGTFSDPQFNPMPGPAGTPTTFTFVEATAVEGT